ncbi:Outer membrane protein SusE [Bacteroides pyogenes]|uniref:SusF/SusE family outer membrane protein n=1 Tax=Bacteroides pyogenes TaxID=310300 RepID=UPI001BA9BCB1|nr:SusF/SusE family outer membrane protein [Bacteroides pyogenes]MBR8720625.1 Outer membrane protein SusE [Bacteroides pyogenes]MBR8725572.1 Outer membrane protein SusE [Bacteroides pyogenes]MBR8738809.1 Outer membrane protein SusE [Bacteroides pyogenes]MBR8754612.1 Outer membrane protein SusE [Bacteroides pyogenes]MBR8787467.1 Outer membrane protein SusE [Bacteroides pyogenes]
MKKSFYLSTIILGLCFLNACSDDEASPIYNNPTEFVLNNPLQADNVLDLKKAETIEITCQRPNYGFNTGTLYTVEVSLDDKFSKSEILGTQYRNSPIQLHPDELALAISNLSGLDEANFFTEPIPLYARLKCVAITVDNKEFKGSSIVSNAVKFSKILPYFALPPIGLPENVYLIGSVCDWSWDKAYAMIPVHSNDGMFWSMQYLGLQNNGDKAAIKFNTNRLWDGEQVGIDKVAISKASKELAGIEGSDNIEIGNPGWYIVVVKVTLEGRKYKYAVDFYKPEVYLTGDTSGGWGTFTADNMFKVPEDKGLFESPALKSAGNIRMCIKLPDIDWWKTEFAVMEGAIVYRGKGGDQDAVAGNAGQKIYLNFADGTGSIK